MSSTWKYIKRKLDDSSTTFGGVYAFDTPAKQSPPFVAFFLNDMEPQFTKDQESSVDLEFWTFIVSDKSVGDAITNADALRTLLDHGGETLEGVTVMQSLFLGRNIPLVEVDEQGIKIFRVIDTYEFRV